jgi:protein-S-isoprenylcysteine O-methyltransferase Ste14
MTHSSTESAERKFTSPAARLQFIGSNILLGVLFAFFAFAAFLNWRRTGHIQSLILAFQELLIVALAITRHHSIAESRSVWDWIVALLGTAAPLLQRPPPTVVEDTVSALQQPLVASPALESIGLALQVVSAALATIAVISLGRSFGIVAANRGVRTVGFYRFVRHPLYGSYMVGYLGFLLGNLSVWNIALIAITVLCQYARAVAEERILLQDPVYQAYAQQVRYRFIPYIF